MLAHNILTLVFPLQGNSAKASYQKPFNGAA